ncbi:MAG: tripartite tricarboxylate transporter substrate binding protein [Proteobacteria bacterium]|nr:tripartite tricarboxylate transporter substrate binding protein [Pseudomonadota bacterium]
MWNLKASAAALLSILFCLEVPVALAQEAPWPNRAIRVIVNFGPGGSADNTMRPFTEKLSKALGQQVVIENRGGASGALGLEALMKSAPDGYTFGVTPSLSMVIVPNLRKTPYDPVKDFAPVVNMTTGTLLFAISPAIPAKSLQEFVAYAKANPGKISWGTAGVGSFGHVMCEAFKAETGTDILHVPYRGGGEALADFLAGVVQVHADPNMFPTVAAGKANLLAVSDRQRHPLYPNVPLLKEIYPQLDLVGWFAMYAPLGTPPAAIKRMNEEINKISADQQIRATLLQTALTPAGGSPEDLGKATADDHARYGALVRKLNIRAE